MGEFGAVSVVSGHIRGRDQHAAAARRDPLQRVQLRRRVRGRLAADPAGAGHAGRSRRWSSGSSGGTSSRAGRRVTAKESRMSIEVRKRPQDVRQLRRARRREPRVPGGRAGRAARAVRLGQDHAAADHRRAGAGRSRARIRFDGEDATDAAVRERRVGFVFQHYALFRHMTVFENVAFGLRVRPRQVRPSEAEIRDTVHGAAAAGAARRAWPTGARRSSPAGSGSAWRWRGRWRSSRRCCCSTSRSARSTPRCARSCAAGCGGCTTRFTSPACS